MNNKHDINKAVKALNCLYIQVPEEVADKIIEIVKPLLIELQEKRNEHG